MALGLAHEAKVGPNGDQRVRMFTELSARLAAEAAAAAETAPPSPPRPVKSVRSGTLLKFGMLITLVGLLGMYWARQEPKAPSIVVPIQPAQPVEDPSVQALSARPERSVDPAPVPLEQPVRRAEKKARVKPAELPTVTPEVEKHDPAAELSILMRARRVLLADPGRTLELAEEHAREYPRGAFAEEREVLAIEALVRTGKQPAAAQRAQAFGKDFPKSTHRTRIQQLVTEGVP
ncbi:MAG: hypothetical protein QM778_21380 [Myxococcales bacterium]